MTDKKPKNVFLGLFLILLAGVVLLGAFYNLKVKPELASRQKIKSDKLKTTQVKLDSRAAEIKQNQNKAGVNMTALLKEAEAVYGPEEKTRKEGFLWIDRASNNLVVTLGALNGIVPGKQLSVYDQNGLKGQVIVDTTFDVISYVHPSETTLDFSQSDYYKVSVE